MNTVITVDKKGTEQPCWTEMCSAKSTWGAGIETRSKDWSKWGLRPKTRLEGDE